MDTEILNNQSFKKPNAQAPAYTDATPSLSPNKNPSLDSFHISQIPLMDSEPFTTVESVYADTIDLQRSKNSMSTVESMYVDMDSAKNYSFGSPDVCKNPESQPGFFPKTGKDTKSLFVSQEFFPQKADAGVQNGSYLLHSEFETFGQRTTYDDLGFSGIGETVQSINVDTITMPSFANQGYSNIQTVDSIYVETPDVMRSTAKFKDGN